MLFEDLRCIGDVLVGDTEDRNEGKSKKCTLKARRKE